MAPSWGLNPFLICRVINAWHVKQSAQGSHVNDIFSYLFWTLDSILNSYFQQWFSDQSWPFKQTHQCRRGGTCSYFTPLPLHAPQLGERVMTALLLANEATFPLYPHLLFPAVYPCTLIHPSLISQACSLQRCFCVYSLKTLSGGGVVVASDAVGRGLWRERKPSSQAGGNKLCSANTCCSKIPVIRERERVCVLWCLKRLYFSGGEGAGVHGPACWWKEASTARAAGFLSSSLSLLGWQWAEVRGQQHQCNTIHHTCQTARAAAGDKLQKLAFHPSLFLSLSLSLYLFIFPSWLQVW